MQGEVCADLAIEHGWPITDKKFDDVGESSETLERPGLQSLIREIEAGQIDRIVVYSVDRLTRRLFDLQRLLELFERHEVVLNIVTDPHFGQSASGCLMLNIVTAASEFQQDLTRERMAEARVALKHKGRRVAGRVPYGYVTDESKQLVINRKEAERVQKLFELAAKGKRPSEIAVIVNKRGWRTRGAGTGSWTARQILKTLSNPTYAGLVRNSSGPLPGQHEAIVDYELFEQVRHAIESRRSRKPGRSKSTLSTPLRGLLKCGLCERAMVPSISVHKNIRYHYYRCRSTAGGLSACRGVCVPAFQMECFIRTLISSGEWQGLIGSEIDEVENFTIVWQPLDEWTQRQRLANVVEEVIFDPDEGTVEITLAKNAAEKIM